MNREAENRMKQIGAAAAKATRHRQWFWCRHWNGFCDKPLWHLVAAKLGMPPFQVIAFVNRLEETVNAAEQRGSVAGFSADEFGFALGMPSEDAARIFAALEDPAIGWITAEHLASFYDRNRDSDDDRDDDRDRKRRSRAKNDALKALVRLAAKGRIASDQRTAIELRLALPPRMLADEDLFALLAELRRAEFSTGPIGHNVTPCDNMLVPEEQTKNFHPGSVDNIADSARGETAGLPKEAAEGTGDNPQDQQGGHARLKEDAEAWLASAGLKIVTERLDEPKTLAATRIERWQHQLLGGDAVALREIIEAVRATDVTVARFLTLITSSIEERRRREAHPQLPLRPVPVGGLERKKAHG